MSIFFMNKIIPVIKSLRYFTSVWRITLFLLITLVPKTIIYGQGYESSVVTVSFDNLTIKDALKRLEAVSRFQFVFADALLRNKARVSGNYQATPIVQVLHAVLQDNGLDYSQDGNNIIISKAKKTLSKKGVLSGKVADSKTQGPIIGAIVSMGNQSVQTDMDGKFLLELPVGEYKITISYMGYKPLSQEIVLKEDKETSMVIGLSEDLSALNEVIITERKTTTTNIALIASIKEARAVVNGISREQIARSQDRDAAEVVRRVAGVSVMQNRFIVIRGMGQRYNTVMLNNAIAPSFEPDSRAFSFDIIPSGMIDRILVYKTAVPELPGDFAGGVVKVYTTGTPVANNLNISYQASYRPSTTFKDFMGQADGKYAWMGYDDGTYKRPIDYPLLQGTDFATRMDATQKFNRNWEAGNKGTALPDQRFNLDFTRKARISDAVRIGIAGGLGYAYTKQYKVQYRNPRAPANADGTVGGIQMINATDEWYDRDIRLSGLVNLSLDIGSHHHISFKNLYTHLGSTRYMYRKGYLPYDGLAEVGIPIGDNLEQFVLTNDYRGIYTGQLNGSHEFFEGKTKINWLAARTRSDFYAPDERRRTHSASSGTIDWKPWIINSAGLGTEGRDQRVYMNGTENVKTLGLDVEQQINILDVQPLLKAGFYWEDKTKSTSYVSYRHIDAALIGGVEGGFNIYEAYNILKAGYLAAEIPFLKKFRLYGGVRAEDNLQHMSTTSRDIVGPNAGPVLLNLKRTTLLPSVNLSYNFTEKTLLRTAYYRTLNRPEFREISSIQYYDMANNSYVYGNPQLLPQADIDNIDLRLEHYPGPGEMITFALFHKKIVNPYELYGGSSTSGVSFIWRNSEVARNYGVEVDMMLGLGRYFGNGSMLSRQAQKISVLFNASYIYSRLELGQEQIFQQFVDHRPLMGQSPYLINAGLNYTEDSLGLKLNIAYNTIGKRIVMVGNQQLATVWELPRHSLDFTFSKRIGKTLELKGGVQNILNSHFVFAQDMNRDGKFDLIENDGDSLYLLEQDNRYQSWYEGSYFTLGLALRL